MWSKGAQNWVALEQVGGVGGGGRQVTIKHFSESTQDARNIFNALLLHSRRLVGKERGTATPSYARSL